MKRIFTFLATVMMFITGVVAKDMTVAELPSGAVTGLKVEQSGELLTVSMTVHPAEFSKKANREVWLTPVITANGLYSQLEPVVVAGRTRYYHHLRSDSQDTQFTLLRAGAPETFSYLYSVPMQEWMQSGVVKLNCLVTGCCGEATALPVDLMATDFDFRPKEIVTALVYVQPVAEEVKTRDVKGEAYIDFPVNGDRILPDYRRNPQELEKIRATIDDVRNNKDVTITSLNIKGYASPEGPYSVNERLAKARTEALATYVQSLYSFPKSVMHTSWVAEDWAGLANRLETLNISNKEEILAIVNDKAMAEDSRDALIKSKYPQQYAFLLEEVYPALRHSDYTVTYVVRNYTEIDEIVTVLRTSPQLLSLSELYQYANTLDKTSPEFREVMEVAVRMFPSDPVANLNAAMTAIDYGEYDKARAYLQKAPALPEATYATALIELKSENYAKAASLLEKAYKAGIREAGDVLEQLKAAGYLD